jgi:glycosyltransferase involved in cell wall biosynthesis
MPGIDKILAHGGVQKAEMPLVSVRTPLYNHAKFVEEALESVLHEGYSNIELLIIDDGSTDGSLEVVQAWLERTKPDFPVTLRSRENRGITKTLNELLRLAQGDYLVSLASDDRLLPGGIAQRLDYLRKTPGKLAVIGDCRVIDHHGAVLHDSGIRDLYGGRLERYTTQAGLLDEIVNNWAVPGSVLMIRQEAYDQTGPYNERLKIEDWDFYLRLVSAGILGFIPLTVSEYRVHENNTVLNQHKRFMNYKQLTLTAWHHIFTVPPSHRLSVLRRLMGLSLRAVFFGLAQCIERIFNKR